MLPGSKAALLAAKGRNYTDGEVVHFDDLLDCTEKDFVDVLNLFEELFFSSTRMDNSDLLKNVSFSRYF